MVAPLVGARVEIRLIEIQKDVEGGRSPRGSAG